MNNKILTSLFLVCCALTASLSSCAQIKASRNYVTKDINVDDFNKIELLGSPTVVYTQSTDGKTKVQIYGSDNLVNLVDINVNNGTLCVKFKKNTMISWKDGRLKVIASSPSLEAAVLKGSGDINLESDIDCNEFLFLLQGSGDINAKGIKSANNVNATLQGSGDIDIKGNIQAQNANFDLQGAGDLKVQNVTASAATARMQGSGDLKVQGVNKIASVEANLEGSGDLYFTGITANVVNAHLQGSGDLKVNGITRAANLSLQNSGDLDAKNLQAVDVTATLNGSGDLNCYATGTLKVGVNGSGEIGYKGNPTKVELINGRYKNIRKL